MSTLRKNQIDAVMIVSLLGSSAYQTNISMPNIQYGHGSVTGNVGSQPVSAHYTYTTVGTTVIPMTVFESKFRAILFDVKKRKEIWVAEGTTAGMDNLSMTSVGVGKTLMELKKTALLKKPIK